MGFRWVKTQVTISHFVGKFLPATMNHLNLVNPPATEATEDGAHRAPITDETAAVAATGDAPPSGIITHFPSFWPVNIPADKNAQQLLQKQLEAEYESTEDWLPEPLLAEVKSCFPSPDDIDEQNEGRRCPTAFSQKITKFFKVGRIFVNYKQFVAAGQFLLDAWAVSSTHAAKSISCYYGAAHGKGKDKPVPKRQPILSPKQLCCPFRVSSLMLASEQISHHSPTIAFRYPDSLLFPQQNQGCCQLFPASKGDLC